MSCYDKTCLKPQNDMYTKWNMDYNIAGLQKMDSSSILLWLTTLGSNLFPLF
jgi:hypothetical protein